MIVLAKLVSSHLQSVNMPTEQIPNTPEESRVRVTPHASMLLQLNSGLLSGLLIAVGEHLGEV
jgi:hypothetical protein